MICFKNALLLQYLYIYTYIYVCIRTSNIMYVVSLFRWISGIARQISTAKRHHRYLPAEWRAAKTGISWRYEHRHQNPLECDESIEKTNLGNG